ncbi:MAG: hypothetical protein R3F04_03835 [Lysobacteraceae bacterium]
MSVRPLFAALLSLPISVAAIAQSADVVTSTEVVESIAQPLNPNAGQIPEGITCGSVIVDNGSAVNSVGTGAGGADESVLQDTSLAMGTFGFAHAPSGTFRVADQFTLASAATLNCISLYAYQTGSTTTSTITDVNLQIWDGVPGAMGSTVVFGDTTTNRLLASQWSNAYRTQESAPGATNRPIMEQIVNLGGLSLPAGTYWIDWQTGGSLASGPWAPPITITGQAVTGDALQFDGTAWGALLDDVNQQGLPFQVWGASGSVLPDPVPQPSVIPSTTTTGLTLLALLAGMVAVLQFRSRR